MKNLPKHGVLSDGTHYELTERAAFGGVIYEFYFYDEWRKARYALPAREALRYTWTLALVEEFILPASGWHERSPQPSRTR